MTEQEYQKVMRTCRCCKNDFPATGEYFYNLSTGINGLHPNCISCCKVSRALEGVRKRDKKVKLSVRQKARAMSLGLTGAQIEDVKLVEVFRKDRGVCQLCHDWVKPKHASMDHIKPLSKGGLHTYANMQLTHFICNQRKSNKEDW